MAAAGSPEDSPRTSLAHAYINTTHLKAVPGAQNPLRTPYSAPSEMFGESHDAEGGPKTCTVQLQEQDKQQVLLPCQRPDRVARSAEPGPEKLPPVQHDIEERLDVLEPPASLAGLCTVTVVPATNPRYKQVRKSVSAGSEQLAAGEASPCAREDSCSASPQHSDLCFPPGMPALLATDEEPYSPSGLNATDNEDEAEAGMPSLSLRDTEHHASGSPTSSPLSSTTASPPSTPPFSPPSSPPSGGFRQSLFAPRNSMLSGMQPCRKLQFRTPFSISMHSHARNVRYAAKPGFRSYWVSRQSPFYSHYSRSVATIPEDCSITCDSSRSDTTHDDLDCVSASFVSVASGDAANACVGTQAMQEGSLVFVPPERDVGVTREDVEDRESVVTGRRRQDHSVEVLSSRTPSCRRQQWQWGD